MSASNETNILELIFSAPGATICVAVIFLVVVIIFAASKPLRDLVAGRSLRIGHFELGQPPSAQGSDGHNENTAVVPPSSAPSDEGTEASSDGIDDEDELPLEVEGESVFVHMMYVAAYGDREPHKIEEAYQKLSSLHGRKMSNENLETLRCRLRLEVGVTEAVDELKELEKKNENWTDPSFVLTDYYKKLERYDLARSHAETAIFRTSNDFEKAFAITQMSDLVSKSSDVREAVIYLSGHISSLTESGAKANVYEKIAELLEDDEWLQAAKALEEALRLNPDKKDTRFKLAYLYSDRGSKLNALYHYRILCSQDANHGFALNNLGVLYGELGLPGKNIEAWKRSAAGGQVFSTGNIALSMIGSGLFDEARALLNSVPPSDRENKRVLYAFNQLNTKPEQESKELEEYIDATKIHHKFMLRAVEQENQSGAIYLKNENIEGTWKSSNGMELTFSLNEGGMLVGKMFDPPINRARAGLLLSQATTRHKYNLYFTLHGMTVSGTASPEAGQYSGGLLSFGGALERSFTFVALGTNKLEGLYWSDEKFPHEIEFNRS